MKRGHLIISALLLVVVLTGCMAEPDDDSRANVSVPSFTVDPSWPLELPNNWILGSVTGVFVDSRQHIWVTHLPETLTADVTAEGPGMG